MFPNKFIVVTDTESNPPLFSFHRGYNPSTSLIRNFKPLAIFCSCTALFVWDQVKKNTPEDRFSRNGAQLCLVFEEDEEQFLLILHKTLVVDTEKMRFYLSVIQVKFISQLRRS